MTLTVSQILQLCAFSTILACGQMLFKQTAQTTADMASLTGLISLATNFWFWLALVCYGFATLLWIYILQSVALSQAYPFVALGFVIIPLCAWLLFGEAIGWPYAAGVLCIIAGIGLIVMTGQVK